MINDYVEGTTQLGHNGAPLAAVCTMLGSIFLLVVGISNAFTAYRIPNLWISSSNNK